MDASRLGGYEAAAGYALVEKRKVGDGSPGSERLRKKSIGGEVSPKLATRTDRTPHQLTRGRVRRTSPSGTKNLQDDRADRGESATASLYLRKSNPRTLTALVLAYGRGFGSNSPDPPIHLFVRNARLQLLLYPRDVFLRLHNFYDRLDVTRNSKGRHESQLLVAVTTCFYNPTRSQRQRRRQD